LSSPQPCSHLFPYTTLFRSADLHQAFKLGRRVRAVGPLVHPRVCGEVLVGHVAEVARPRLVEDALQLRLLVRARGEVLIAPEDRDRKSTRLNSSHVKISYAV